MKGALNRLAESNLHVIARQIEDLFMANSRNLMNECLCQILTSSKLIENKVYKINRHDKIQSSADEQIDVGRNSVRKKLL